MFTTTIATTLPPYTTHRFPSTTATTTTIITAVAAAAATTTTAITNALYGFAPNPALSHPPLAATPAAVTPGPGPGPAPALTSTIITTTSTSIRYMVGTWVSCFGARGGFFWTTPREQKIPCVKFLCVLFGPPKRESPGLLKSNHFFAWFYKCD